MTDSYRPVRVLDAPPGFVAAIVATMRPKPEARAPVSSVDPEVDRKAAAILMVLEEQPPMSMRALWKRVHAERFPAGMWDKCIQYLLDGGYIRFIEGGLLGQRRVEAVPKP